MITHDPKQIVRGLQQILIDKQKRIGFLFGAGTSFSLKKGASIKSRVPLITEMTNRVVESITEDKYRKAIEVIEKEFEKNKQRFNIEYLLSDITQKEKVIGEGELCNLNKEDLNKLREEVENKIVNLVQVHKDAKNFIEDLIHVDFASWICNAARTYSIEIFTTNYDYLFEIGFEKMNLPYFDGFVGTYQPFFDSNCVENFSIMKEFTKLWKLHGSLGWEIDKTTKKITRTYPDAGKHIIFPSYLKYDDSKKQPYVSFMDRLSKFIKMDDSVLFVCGYSFSDEHINDILNNSILNSSFSHIIFFLFDKIIDEKGIVRYSLPECPLCKIAENNPKISVYGMKHAVIGRQLGEWKLNREPDDNESIDTDSYFDLDFDVKQDIVKDIEFSKDETAPFSGEGIFKLPDFAHFVEFLKKEVMPEDYVKKVANAYKSNE